MTSLFGKALLALCFAPACAAGALAQTRGGTLRAYHRENPASGICCHPQLRNVTPAANSIYDHWRLEDAGQGWRARAGSLHTEAFLLLPRCSRD